jgi:indolepyruvate ferredoxin oxidoreductase
MITQPEIGMPADEVLAQRVAAVTREGARHWADADAITTALQGDAVTANVFVLGMAVQSGRLPVRAASIERALELNGVAVEANRAAFRWGRSWIADPERVAAAIEARSARPGISRAPLETPGPDPATSRLAGPLRGRLRAIAGEDEEALERLALWWADLVAYQDVRLAETWLVDVERVARAEDGVVARSRRLALTVAASLHKLLAWKDEYEVARLMLDAEGCAPARAQAGPGDRVAWLLHPPLLRAVGLRRKIRVGTWAAPLLRWLAAAKRLRGTPLDPFGWTRLRRIERALPGEYRETLAVLLAHLKPSKLDEAVGIASLPQEIRGYEALKLARVAEVRERIAERLAAYCR